LTNSAPRALVVASSRGAGSPGVGPLVPLLGLPLVAHVLSAVEEVAPLVVLTDGDPESVRQALGRRDLTLLRTTEGSEVPEPGAARELLDGTSTLLVVAADRPLVRAETLRALLADHEESGAVATMLAATIGAFATNALRPLLADDSASRVASFDEAAARLASRHAVRTFAAPDPQESLAVSSMADLAGAARLIRDRQLARVLAAGVLVEDPSSTTVAPGVTVEAGAHLRPFTILEGRTVVRKGASVGPFARVVDSEIGEDAQVLDHCLLRECVVETGASVGPFAHLRPESRVGARARVGNFVELKKTHLGEGSKAPHLSYLGDSTIGPGVNVGAGTITCNYDGTHKHPTRIEAGAFVGSNTTLVAPVVVGDGAYVAAGSTITADVPPRTLALGRARQVVKEGWVRRKKEETPAKG
jgi:bifunctional UDP-N-acetylglucosamine pyrophosphorylase/glucosamine-1-phosphate N-acetyltransferase